MQSFRSSVMAENPDSEREGEIRPAAIGIVLQGTLSSSSERRRRRALIAEAGTRGRGEDSGTLEEEP